MVISSPSVEESAFLHHCFGRDRIEFINFMQRVYQNTLPLFQFSYSPSCHQQGYPHILIIISSSAIPITSFCVRRWFSSSLNRSYFRESKRLCRLLASDLRHSPRSGSRLPYHSLSAYIVAAALGCIHISTVLALPLRRTRQSPLQPR